MNTQIKYIVFKGIDKKEEILFKSFLNLAKNELDYQVVVLKANDQSQAPDFVIADESYQFADDEGLLASQPMIKVGDSDSDEAFFIQRPIQWSDFKEAFYQLESPLKESDETRVLPNALSMEIDDSEASSTIDDTEDDSDIDMDSDDYEYELANLSVDYHSFTNSDYVKVVDDVKGFHDGLGEAGGNDATPIVLVTDDESRKANSVLVLETDSVDAWDMSVSEFEDDAKVVAHEVAENLSDSQQEEEVDAKVRREIKKKLSQGEKVRSGDKFWQEDVELYSGNKVIAYLRPARDTVYSQIDASKWPLYLRSRELTKLSLSDSWNPSSDLKAYPIEYMKFNVSLAFEGNRLLPDLDADKQYILSSWPDFELLEFDNMLLKLCTLLFVKPQTSKTLMKKTGYSRSIVFGLMNACHEMGLLKSADEVEIEVLSELSNQEDGMIGKLKEVFR